MRRRYTLREKQIALTKLERNRGDVPKTSRELGIPRRTLRSWRAQGFYTTEVEQLRQLRQRLIGEALELASHIKQVMKDAPLNQRANALNQMIDKILKITEVLEEGDEDEAQAQTPILRIEYVDEYGQVHSTPPDAESDFE